MRYYLAAAMAIALLMVPWFAVNYPAQFEGALVAIEYAGNQIAAVILSHKPKSIAEIQAKYNASTSASFVAAVPPKVRILVMPGHEPGYGGAEYGPLKERDMTVELGQDLYNLLSADPHYSAFLARDGNAWSADLSSYFKDNWYDIVAWTKASREEMSHLIAVGSVSQPVSKVYHNTAPSEVALRLYGITKWANEHDIDITIHIHFNDYPGHGAGPGEHSGFAIYVPASQYGNSTTTKAIADSVFRRLAKYNPSSDLPGEQGGIVDEPDLIAIGANNTSDAASMVIEYEYIYQPQFSDPAVRSMALKELAYETYLGLQDFFAPSEAAKQSKSYDTLVMPYQWKNPISSNVSGVTPDIFAMQTAFLLDGIYPPGDKNKNDCPRSGKFGPCTKAALQAFQNRYGITGEQGMVGPQTIQQLNSLYSVRRI